VSVEYRLLFGRFRSLRARTALSFSAIVSTVLVLSFIPMRWEGERTATDAYIPLRPLTPAEAAALLRHSAKDTSRGRTAVVELDEATALVATTVYLVKREVPPSDECRAENHVTVGDTTYEVCSASWESFSTLHEIDRRGLENELGRSLNDADVDSTFLDKWPSSFSSYLLPLYAIVEILFLTVLLSATLLGLSRLRRRTAVLPFLAVACALPTVFTLVYSPAFLDADWFHQRIAIESVGLYSMLAFGVMALPAGASLALLLSLSGAEWIAKIRAEEPGKSQRRESWWS
jgi:hypothetical protein